MLLTRIHRVMCFKERAWLKPFMSHALKRNITVMFTRHNFFRF